MLDIVEGDQLVVGAKTYRIRFVGEWGGWGVSSSFKRLANVSASTKRAGAVAGGKRADPTTNLASLSCTPIDPASSDLAQTIATKAPYELKECFAGDSTGFVRLALEEMK
jgi:hypothetical protein